MTELTSQQIARRIASTQRQADEMQAEIARHIAYIAQFSNSPKHATYVGAAWQALALAMSAATAIQIVQTAQADGIPADVALRNAALSAVGDYHEFLDRHLAATEFNQRGSAHWAV